jgi:osmotically-inducible protein OsmY
MTKLLGMHVDRCSNHQPELSLAVIPLSKVCRNCGHIESLNRNEIFWPARARDGTKRNRTLLSVSQAIVSVASAVAIVALIAFGPVLYSRLRLVVAKIEAASWVHGQLAQRSIITHDSVELPEESVPLVTIRTADEIQSDKKEAPENAYEQSRMFTDSPLVTRAFNNTAEGRAKQLQQRVSRAISNRAITGVDVTIDQTTAYLQGTVQTETQRLIAERTAQGIPGLKEIKNSIRVEWHDDNQP